MENALFIKSTTNHSKIQVLTNFIFSAFHKDVHQDDGKNSMLKPPEKDKRRHSLGGKLAAAFHL